MQMEPMARVHRPSVKRRPTSAMSEFEWLLTRRLHETGGTVPRGISAVTAVVAVLTLASCGEQVPANGHATPAHADSSSTSGPPGDPAEGAPRVNVEAVKAAFDGVFFDYEWVDFDELAKDSELVMTGDITGFRVGPELYPDEAGTQPTVIMSVNVNDVVQGAQPASDVVDVLMLPPMGGPPALESAMPSGTRVGIYLTEADLASAGIDSEIVRGTPAGSKIWQTGPQGFMVANGEDGGVLYPYGEKVDLTGSMRQSLPRKR